MRLQETPLLPLPPANDEYSVSLRVALSKVLREHALKTNQLASGFISGNDGTSTTVPTTGAWFQGDFVKKSNPVEAGAAASKYVIVGWVRLTSGSANVLNTDWVEMRTLTGN